MHEEIRLNRKMCVKERGNASENEDMLQIHGYMRLCGDICVLKGFYTK